MISLKSVHNHHHFNSFLNNVPFTFFISSNSSKFMYLSAISRRPFSRSAQSAHTADENILNSTEPLSRFFRSVIRGGARTESSRGVAETAELKEAEARGMSDRLINLEEEVRYLNKNRSENAKTLHMEKKDKGSLRELFSDKKKEQSESKSISKSKMEAVSAPVERIAYGVEDPTVHKELSSDMKMLAELLYEKGYFKDANFIPKDKFDPSFFEISYAREFLRFAALNFGKDHPEIAGWLSAGDLKKVALFGCPSLGQKTIFAAKHMRKFFKIDEQKVCQTCTLKKLCNHSNKSSKKPATKLHLASVIKVLLMYAMESVPEKLVVPEEVQNSVSRLLKEVICLSQDTP